MIFHKEHGQLLPVERYSRAFTPTLEQIVKAESLLTSQIAKLDSSRSQNNLITQPVIRRNLNRYHRQYFGMISSDGRRLLWINFIWSDDIDVFPDWECRYIPVIEADTWVWSIYIDLENSEYYRLETGESK